MEEAKVNGTRYRCGRKGFCGYSCNFCAIQKHVKDRFGKEEVSVHILADLLKVMEVKYLHGDNFQNETADEIGYGNLTDEVDKLMHQRQDNGDEEGEAEFIKNNLACSMDETNPGKSTEEPEFLMGDENLYLYAAARI